MLNSVELVGRLTKEPEAKSTTTGTTVCGFSVAVQRNYKNANGEYDSDFINCVAFRNTAEFLDRYFHKGDPIIIKGAIQTRSYDDENGKKRYVTEVIANEISFCPSSRKEETAPAQLPNLPEEFNADSLDLEDDLPF